MQRLLSLLCLLVLAACASQDSLPQDSSRRVLVSIAPYRYFVERLAGDAVETVVLVPPGASAHHYEPTPRQVIDASAAHIWFRFGENFELLALEAMTAHNPELQVLDLREELPLIASTQTCNCHGEHHEHHHHEVLDPHIWLSARLAKLQAQKIAKALSTRYPELAESIAVELKLLEQDLDQLDQQMAEIFERMPNKKVLVSHDAYAYLCRDYGLEQIPVEWKGKDPTVKQLGKTLEIVRQEKLTRVFIQPQHNAKGAELIAGELDLEIVELDPYGEKFIDNLLHIAKAFAGE